jgi:DNA-binding MarR family transcriptional regulator
LTDDSNNNNNYSYFATHERMPRRHDDGDAPTSNRPAVKPGVHPFYRRHIGHLSRRLQQICHGILTTYLIEDGLTLQQYAALTVVADMPGIDQRGLAHAVGVVPVNAGQMASELEAMGLVDRRTSATDRRARELRLSSRGEQVMKRVLPRNLAAVERIVSCLDHSEREKLMDLLIRVIEWNEAYARPGLGRRKRRPNARQSGETLGAPKQPQRRPARAASTTRKPPKTNLEGSDAP